MLSSSRRCCFPVLFRIQLYDQPIYDEVCATPLPPKRSRGTAYRDGIVLSRLRAGAAWRITTAGEIMKVLILEDDCRVLDLLCLILSSRGYDVIAASTAKEALKYATQAEPVIDLLIADIVLTFSSGIQVGVQLRRRIPRLKVLLISGYPVDAWRDEDHADLTEFPADSMVVLSKPFLPELLIEKVGRLIGFVEERA